MTHPKLNTRRGVALLTLALAAFGSPLTASDTADCYEQVIELCDATLEDASWWQKPAIGVFCAGMLAGCAVESITISAS